MPAASKGTMLPQHPLWCALWDPATQSSVVFCFCRVPVFSSAIVCCLCSPHAYPPLVATLLTTYKEQLGAPGSIRNMAALLLGRLLTRPDQGAALRDFVQWAGGVLASSSVQNVFILPGEVTHCAGRLNLHIV